MYICLRSMKEKILETAANLFIDLGFKSVTMDDLANHMGISKKTIYTHFANKTKLVEESTLHLFYYISNGINNICAFEKDPIEELVEIKKFVMQHLKNEKSSPQYQLQKYYPKIYKDIREKQYDVMEECVTRNIKRGINLGIYRDNLNIDFISRIYFSGIMNIKDEDLFPTNLFSKTALMDDYLEYHIRGIATLAGEKKLNSIINSNQN